MNESSYEERSKVYTQARSVFGASSQLIKAIEELSEVQKEICKTLTGEIDMEHLAEEVADASIMLEQVRHIFDIDDKVRGYMDAKITRLESRITERRAAQSPAILTPDELARLAWYAERLRGHG